MKINSLQHDMTFKQGNFRLHSEPQDYREKENAGMYKNNRGYNADYCGSFTGKSETAATVMKKGFIDRFLSSDWFGKFAKYSNEHNISTSALIALVLAGILRPATIMALPGDRDKEDKIYASGHAMASGIIGFLVSTAITSPFDESIKKFFGNPQRYLPANKNTKSKASKPTLERMKNAVKYLENKIKNEKTAGFYDPLRKTLQRQIGSMETLVKNIPDWIIGVPRAILTIALIPPILKYVFGVEKKQNKPPDSAPNTTGNKTGNSKIDFVNKPVFASFRGGVN